MIVLFGGCGVVIFAMRTRVIRGFRVRNSQSGVYCSLSRVQGVLSVTVSLKKCVGISLIQAPLDLE